MQVTVTQSWAEKHWKLLVLVAAGALYASYRAGEYEADQRYETERQQAAIRAAEVEREWQQRISQAQTQAAKTIEVVKWRTKTIQEKADDWAKTHPDSDCHLDADGLSLWNSAHARPAAGVQ